MANNFKFIAVFLSFSLFFSILAFGLSAKSDCVDSDNGNDYFVKGYARIGDREEYSEDECYGDRLSEAYCNGAGGTSIAYHFCEFGCKHGACLKSSTEPRPHSIYIIQESIGELPLSYQNTVEREGKTQIHGQYRNESISVDVWISFPAEELDNSKFKNMSLGEVKLYHNGYDDIESDANVYQWISENKKISINTLGKNSDVVIIPLLTQYLDKYVPDINEPEKGFFKKIIDWVKNLFR